MTYAAVPYGGGPYAGTSGASSPVITTDIKPALAVEVAFTTDPFASPVWVDVTLDVREWDVKRGRNRELERFQPGRATIVLSNASRDYDSAYEDSPHFGFLKPMRRIRIRETFNGVTYPTFDGFVDRWQLDYPLSGKDATATVTATDGFKPAARADLPRSVYVSEVTTSAPLVWWRLDETVARLRDGVALNSGTGGSTYDGTFVGSPVVGQGGLVVNDPGSALGIRNAFAATATPVQGVSLANAALSLLSQAAFSVEAWVRMDAGGTTQQVIWDVSRSADANQHAVCGYFDTDGSGAVGRFQFAVFNSAFTLAYGVETPAGSVFPGQIHHVVAAKEVGGQLAIWLDGVRYTSAISGLAGTSLSGITVPTTGNVHVGYEGDSSPNAERNWHGSIQHVAVYVSQLSDAGIAAHYAAGTAPWQGDLPGVRAGRILDLMGWPDDLRSLDDGDAELQSANLGMSGLEHLQKVGESEYGLWFWDRDGNARLTDRATVFGRPVVWALGGDGVGYRKIMFDDGDAVIRNRATISRLNGVAKTVTDATSEDEFGRSDYTLDGLFHRSDSYSEDYATFVVEEYKDPRRRVASVELGPADATSAADLCPVMLGVELGDAVSVEHQPSGGGDPFTQDCVVEGLEHRGVPGGGSGRSKRTSTWVLSPAPTNDF